MADYPEETIRAMVAAHLHQGMDDEEVHAVECEVRDQLAAEPPVEPMSPLRRQIIEAGGWNATHTHRDEEAFRLAREGEGGGG